MLDERGSANHLGSARASRADDGALALVNFFRGRKASAKLVSARAPKSGCEGACAPQPSLQRARIPTLESLGAREVIEIVHIQPMAGDVKHPDALLLGDQVLE